MAVQRSTPSRGDPYARMIEHTFQVLEYARLLDRVAEHAASMLGRAACLALRPLQDPAAIEEDLRRVAEMRLLLKVRGFPALAGVTDLEAVLVRAAAKGAALTGEELLEVVHTAEATDEIRRFMAVEDPPVPRLAAVARELPALEGLIGPIRRALEPNGTLKDGASPALGRLREQKLRLRLELQEGLENVYRSLGLGPDARDHLLTVRDGRYVMALRTEYKRRVAGVVHDYSRTRATCYIEPLSVLDENNRLAELQHEERNEEHRILVGLTDRVREHHRELRAAQDVLAQLDGLYARARFAEALGCVMPEMGEDQDLTLLQAHNPVLLYLALERRRRGEETALPVPIDLVLPREKNILVISGPNRGGKTVALKTLGLLILMAQAGLHVPAREGSRLPVFDGVLADIGDEQDLEAGLSTFSAHAERLRDILEQAGERSLVIVDEPGNGTDPNEGAALAMAVLDRLTEQGTWVAVSTHLNRLKTYGLQEPRVTSAAVAFDTRTLAPTFRLNYGSPGISRALDMARNAGLPEAVLTRAREYLDPEELAEGRLMGRLQELVDESGKAKAALLRAEARHREALSRLQAREAAFEAEKEAFLRARKKEAEQVLEEARAALKAAINDLKSRPRGGQGRARAALDRIGRELEAHFSPPTSGTGPAAAPIRAGQWVFHRRVGQKGRVLQVDPDAGRAQVALGPGKMSARLCDLEPAEADRSAAGRGVGAQMPGAVPRELNVIGFRVEEAIPLIDKTLDRALLGGGAQVRIIHGFGTGRLRKAIRSHLKTLPFVKSIESADARLGGEAITEVKLS